MGALRLSGRVAGVPALLALALMPGCQPGAPPVDLPGFADALPGNTVAVVWSEAAVVEESPPWEAAVAPLIGWLSAWLGLSTRAAPGVTQAWVSDASDVAWPYLRDSSLFAAACTEMPPGGRRVFVDLQQLVDVALARARQPVAATPWQGLQGVFVERVASALALRGLEWLAVGERPDQDVTEWQAVLASTEGNAGLLGLLAEQAPPVSADALVCGDARLVACVAFVPRVAVGVLRDLMAGEGDGGALQMARELLRGPRFDAALDALGALAGGLRLAARPDGAIVALAVADVRALGDALDVLAQPSVDGWMLAGWRLQLAGSTLTAKRGAIGSGGPPLPSLRPGVWLSLPAAGVEATLTHATGSGRAHARVRWRRGR